MPTIVRGRDDVRVHPPGVMHPTTPGFAGIGDAMSAFCEMSHVSAVKFGSIGGCCTYVYVWRQEGKRGKKTNSIRREKRKEKRREKKEKKKRKKRKRQLEERTEKRVSPGPISVNHDALALQGRLCGNSTDSAGGVWQVWAKPLADV